MKIRMKVKHLVWISITIVMLVSLLSMVVFPQLHLYMAEKKLENGEAEGKEDIIQMLNGNLMDSQKWRVIRDHMIDDGVANQFAVYVGPSFTQQTNFHESIHFTWSEKIPYIEDYVESGPIDGYLVNAAKQLSSFYEREGNIAEAKDILKSTAERFSKSNVTYHQDELLLERIKLAKNHSEFTEAEQYINELTEKMDPEDYYLAGEIAKIKTELIIRQGKLEEAYEEVKAALKEYEENWQKEKEQLQEELGDEADELADNIENSVVYDQLKSLERHLNIAMDRQGDSIVTVKGKVVRNDGTPMGNVGVYLRDKYSVNSSVQDGEPYQVLTDQEGIFEFQGVIPDSYQVFLGFTYDQIDGWTWPLESNEWIDIDGTEDITYEITLHPLLETKSPVNQEVITDDAVHFEWEEVEGAAYYKLNLSLDIESGAVSSEFKSGIRQNKLVVPIEELYDQLVGVSFGEDDVADPLTLLAFTNPENRFSWSVDAYNSEDNLITRSNGYRLNEDTMGNLPFFKLKERKLTDADQLLLDYKHDEALDEYKKNYNQDRTDTHSLRMIVRLIGYESDGSIHNRTELALPYLKDMAERSTSAQYTFELFNYFYQEGKWMDFQVWYDRYLEITNEKQTDYAQAIYASALMKQGNYLEASELFEEVMEMDESNRFVGRWVAIEVYLNESFEAAMKIAEDYPERAFGGDHRDWYHLLKQMKEESNESDNYRKELEQVLEWYFYDQEEELSEWIESTDKVNMKEFIETLLEVR